MVTIGYAFVNFVTPEAAQECISKLDGLTDCVAPGETCLNVYWSEKDQGLMTIVDRHRNSPVMHDSVREEFRPAIYMDGIRVAFPPPTKHVRPPRMQRYNKDQENAEVDEDQY